MRALARAAVVVAVAVLAVGCGGPADRPDGTGPPGAGIQPSPTRTGGMITGGAGPGGASPPLDGGSDAASGWTPPSVDLAGAERVGGGGAIHPNVAPVARLQGAPLADVDLREATAVALDGDGGVWVLVQGQPGTGRRPIAHGLRSTALRVEGDRIDEVRAIPGGTQAWLMTARAGADVRVGAHAYGEVTADAPPEGMNTIQVLAADEADDRAVELPRSELTAIEVLALTDDGTLLAGRDPTRIDAFAADGTVRHVLGFAGFESDTQVEVDEPLGDIASLVALPDDRVAFVTDDGDGRLLRLLDGGRVRTVDAGPRDGAREIHAITPGPDGRLLAVVAGAQVHPQIHLVDVERGDADVVADLRGVVPAAEGRGVAGALWAVAAATDGRDLVFLADGYLWRLEGAFT